MDQMHALLLVDGEAEEHLRIIRELRSNDALRELFEDERDAVMPEMSEEDVVATLDGLDRIARARCRGLGKLLEIIEDTSAPAWQVSAAHTSFDRMRLGIDEPGPGWVQPVDADLGRLISGESASRIEPPSETALQSFNETGSWLVGKAGANDDLGKIAVHSSGAGASRGGNPQREDQRAQIQNPSVNSEGGIEFEVQFDTEFELDEALLALRFLSEKTDEVVSVAIPLTKSGKNVWKGYVPPSAAGIVQSHQRMDAWILLKSKER